jgi:hypothetical protein
MAYDFLDAKSWCLSLPSGEAPSRRTCHSAAAVDNRLFIFGGGQSGAEPVQDDKLYVYNASKETSYWKCNVFMLQRAY